MMKAGRSILFLFLCMLPDPAARALDPVKRISQYAHTAWRLHDGALSGAPNAITQTRDGYLWIGTDGGLVRFDGVRFVPWSPANGKHLSDPRIIALLGSRDGTLWIGTATGPVHWTGNDLIQFPGVAGRINAFLEDRSGTVWLSRSRVRDGSGPLCRAINNKLKCYAGGDGITVAYAGPIAMDGHGYLWMGSPSTLSRWKAGSYQVYAPKRLEKAEGLTGVNGIAVMPDDSLWVGIQRAGPGLGLERFVDAHWLPFHTPALNGSTLGVTTLFLDREDSLWIGTTKDGIYRIHGEAVDHFSHADGLSGDAINCFFQDAEGTLWVATSRGIDSFRDLPITTYSTAEGLSSDRAGSIVAARDGTIWVGNSGSLDSIRDGKVSSIRPQNGLPGIRVTALFEDHAGTLWVGIDSGLWILEHGHFTPVTKNGKPIGLTFAMAEDASGNLWANVIASPARLVRIHDGRVQQEVSFAKTLVENFVGYGSGLLLALANGEVVRYQDGQFVAYPMKASRDSGGIRNFCLDVDGGIWGVTATVLVRRQNGEVQSLGPQNGYVTQQTYALIIDAQQSLWAYTSAGLFRITRNELNRWWKSPASTITMTKFDVFDGAQPSAASFRPRATRAPDGRLWFANDNVVQVIDPSQIKMNTLLPPVQIEQITADRKTYAMSNGLRLPALTRDLESDYTGLSFIAPEKMRFRYLLEGRDRSWQEAGTRRQAFYTDLGPGKYRFRVTAANASGVWNESGTAVEFAVLPSYYQTLWFRVLCALSAMALMWFLYRLRIRQLATITNERFEVRMAERTRLARELHDTLLQTLQGSKLFADTALKTAPNATQMRYAIGSLSGWLERAITEVRTSLSSLRIATWQENSLGEALRLAARDCRQDADLEFSFAETGLINGIEPGLDPVVREEVYRIGYEAILNAFRHSQASKFEVKLNYLPDLCLSVHDNGQGIDPVIASRGKDHHFGLRGMGERAKRVKGNLTIVSEGGRGTRIDLSVPGKIAFPRHSRWNTFLTRVRSFFKAPDPKSRLPDPGDPT
jgi:signal transduction histidine kinase/ligand-binding sensor domain-containing protein